MEREWGKHGEQIDDELCWKVKLCWGKNDVDSIICVGPRGFRVCTANDHEMTQMDLMKFEHMVSYAATSTVLSILYAPNPARPVRVKIKTKAAEEILLCMTEEVKKRLKAENVDDAEERIDEATKRVRGRVSKNAAKPPLVENDDFEVDGLKVEPELPVLPSDTKTILHKSSSSDDKKSPTRPENLDSPRKSIFGRSGSSASKKKKEQVQIEKIEPKFVDLEEVSD